MTAQQLDALCAAALARMKHSLGTSAGMHKAALRKKVAQMQFTTVVSSTLRDSPARSSPWPFHVEHHRV